MASFGIPGQQRIVQGIVSRAMHRNPDRGLRAILRKSSSFEWIEDYCVSCDLANVARRKGYVKRTKTKKREYRFGKYRLNVVYRVIDSDAFYRSRHGDRLLRNA